MATDGLFAQNFGLKGGLNLATMLMKDDDDTYSDDFKMNPGFHAGVTAEFPLAKIISLETSVLLSTKGFNYYETINFTGEPIQIEEKLNLLYLDLPLTVKSTFDIGGARIYGAFGPYIGIGLNGKRKVQVTSNGETITDEADLEWKSDFDGYSLKRLDYGLTMGVGVEVKSFQLGVSYGLGLANISTYNTNGLKLNNRVLGGSIGYIFGRV